MSSRGARQARRAEAVSLAQCLGHLGVGMEPDVRFARPPPEHRLMQRQPDNTMLFDYALNPAQIRLLYAQRNERPQ
jgi:hypothetical protein